MNEAVRWYAPPLEEPPPPAEDVPVELPRPPSLEEIQRIRDDAHREGHDEGYAAGHAEGFAQGQAEIRRLTAQIEGILDNFSRPLARLENEVVAALGDLAVRVAGGLVGRVYEADPGLLADLVAEAVDAVGGAAREVEVRLHPDDIAALTDLLRDTDIVLLSDEVYEHIVFDGARHESALRHPRLRERAFVVSSFGKTYHCTGWKLGYCIAPPGLSAEFRKVHQYNVFCTFAPAQHAFAAMLDAEPEHYEQLGAFYQAKRDRFREQLRDTRLQPLPVAGGYFQLVDYSAVSDLDDAAFCRWLTIEHGVAAIPLSPFYAQPPPGQRLARLCFAKNEATLDAAIERLRAL
mgnify:CR=1 FL=1